MERTRARPRARVATTEREPLPDELPSPCHQSLSLVSRGEPVRSCRRADFRSSSSAFSQCSASEGFGVVPPIWPGGCCAEPGGRVEGGWFGCDPGGEVPDVPAPDEPAP